MEHLRHFLCVAAWIAAPAWCAAKAQTIPGDECALAQPLVTGLTVGSTDGASTSPEPVPCAGLGADVWFFFFASESGLLSVLTATSAGVSDFDTVLATYEGDCGQLVQLACSDHLVVDWPYAQIEVPVTAGHRYLVRLGGKNGASGNYLLETAFAAGALPGNDECSSPLLVTASQVHGSTTLATWSGLKTSCIAPVTKDVWFRWVAPMSGSLELALTTPPGVAPGTLCIVPTCTSQYLESCTYSCYEDGYASVETLVQQGETLVFSVGDVGGAAGGEFTVSLEFQQPPPADTFYNPFSGHTYLLTPTAMTWHDARAWAESVHGHLVTLGDGIEAGMLQQHFVTYSSRTWIGLTDEAAEGSFVWVTGEPVAFTAWAAGQPDDQCASSADYAAMQPADGQWSDFSDTGCGKLLRGLVEIEGTPWLSFVQMVGEGCPAATPPLLGGTLPILGHDLKLLLVDPVPGGTGALYGSAVPAGPQPFAGCELQLDLLTRFFVAQLAVGPDGVGELKVAIPGDASLLGLGFMLQAAVKRPHEPGLALSNGLELTLGY